MFIDDLNNLDFQFSAICIQESLLGDHSDISLIQLKSYACIPQSRLCSKKGGLIINLNDKYNYKVMNINKKSSVWEGKFIEINIWYLVHKTIHY